MCANRVRDYDQKRSGPGQRSERRPEPNHQRSRGTLMAESNSTRHPLITTGSFASAGKNANAVAVSRGIPPGFKGRRYTPLAPTAAMLRLKSIEEFYAAYREVLSLLGAG